jgi:hypothetical protein
MKCFSILLVLLPLLAVASTAAHPAAPKLEVLAVKFGPIGYDNVPAGQSFAVQEAIEIDAQVDYYGWVIHVRCPAHVESIEWTEVTTMAAANPTYTPGVSEDDDTITVADDRKSFTTRRGSLCKDGVAHLEDLYGREDSEPLGPWRIEVKHGNQLLADIHFSLTAHFVR